MSAPEESILMHIKAMKLPEPQREFLFHPTRKWRFDFAWPAQKIAAECEGAVWVHGRHTRGSGFTSDCYKYNQAAYLGWLVFRFTPDMIRNGEAVDTLKGVLANG